MMPQMKGSQRHMDTAAMPRLTLGGKDLSAPSAGCVTAPLVSFVLINFNYAEFVGAAIESIKHQDYRHIECLVIDNASTDSSVSVIESHIKDDKRFSFIQFSENLGQLGATNKVIDCINGSFVVFVDADDLLLPSFCSTHVQVHLALAESVAFTSSNLVEINKTGDVLTGKSSCIKTDTPEFVKGLRPAAITPRLSTIDVETYNLLNGRCATIASTCLGWHWTYGTSNMYRASIIKLIRINDQFPIPKRFADNYLIPLAHAMAKSALIDLTLSAYRIHGNNIWVQRESVNSLKNYGPDYDAKQIADFHMNQEIVLSRSVELNWLSRNLWNLINRMADIQNSDEQKPYYSSTPIIDLFAKYASQMQQALSPSEYYSGIAMRFGLWNGLKIILSDYKSCSIFKSLSFVLVYFIKIRSHIRC
jgi:glycosyltransferase involved in cell wall biosynthesis